MHALHLPICTLRFEKIVTKKLASGSRKTRADLLQESIYRHNKQAVNKARIMPDEVTALYVYDAAPPDIRRMLKVIWGTEVPAHTAVPLHLLSGNFWLPKKSLSLKVNAQQNPLWHTVCSHSWDKVAEYIRRLEGKWNAKCPLIEFSENCCEVTGRTDKKSQLVVLLR